MPCLIYPVSKALHARRTSKGVGRRKGIVLLVEKQVPVGNQFPAA